MRVRSLLDRLPFFVDDSIEIAIRYGYSMLLGSFDEVVKYQFWVRVPGKRFNL